MKQPPSPRVRRPATLGAVIVLMLVASLLPLASTPVAAVTEYRYEVVATPPTPLAYKGVAWSPDGSEAMVVGGVQAVLRYDPEARIARKAADSNWSTPSQTLEGVAHVGSGVAYVAGGRLEETRVLGDLWRVSGGAVVQVDSIEGDILSGVAASREGRLLAVSALGSVFELVAGELSSVGKAGDVPLHDLAWSPGGEGAFVVGGAGTVSWFDASEGTLVVVQFTSTHPLYSVSWRPGTDVAWAVGEGGLVVELNATSLEASRVRPHTPRAKDFYGISWHPKGDRALVVGEGGTTVLWRMGVFTEQLVTHSVDLLDAMWSPTGDEALVTGDDGTLLRYSPRLDPPNRAPNAVIASPDDGVVVDEGTPLLFDGTPSSDPDGDPLSFTWSSNRTGVFGTKELMEHRLSLGVHRITLAVKDGQGGNSTQEVTVRVRAAAPPEQRLHVTIDAPAASSVLRGQAVFSGTATYETGRVEKVELAFDGGRWRIAAGTAQWSLSLDTTLLGEGIHGAVARATSDDGLTKEATLLFEVRNAVEPVPPAVPNVTLHLRDRALVDELVAFEAEGGNLSTWELVWSFGDGSNARGTEVHHAYRSPGRYEVTLELWLEGSTEPAATFTTTVIIRDQDGSGPSLETVFFLLVSAAGLIYVIGFYAGRRAFGRD